MSISGRMSMPDLSLSAETSNAGTQMSRPTVPSIEVSDSDFEDVSALLGGKLHSRHSSRSHTPDVSSGESPFTVSTLTTPPRNRVIKFASRVRITSGIHTSRSRNASVGGVDPSRSSSRSSSVSDSASSMSVPLRPSALTAPHAYAQGTKNSALSTVMNSDDANAFLNGLRGPITRPRSQADKRDENITESAFLNRPEGILSLAGYGSSDSGLNGSRRDGATEHELNKKPTEMTSLAWLFDPKTWRATIPWRYCCQSYYDDDPA